MNVVVVVFLMLDSSEDPILDFTTPWDWDSIIGLKLWVYSIAIIWVPSVVTILICLKMKNYAIKILH